MSACMDQSIVCQSSINLLINFSEEMFQCYGTWRSCLFYGDSVASHLIRIPMHARPSMVERPKDEANVQTFVGLLV